MTDEVATGDQMEAAAPLASTNGESNGAGMEQRTVPLDALQAERQHRQKLEEEVRLMKDHLSLLSANREVPERRPKDEFDGVSDEDLVTVKDLKRLLTKKEQEFQMSMEEVRMSQKHPDYADVVTRYLPEVLKQNPSLQRSLVQTKDYELAYYLAKNSDGYKSATRKEKVNHDAERIVKNSQQSGSLASVGHTSPISEAKRWKEMSDSDFRAAVAKNMGYA
jgi:hypothetical protein